MKVRQAHPDEAPLIAEVATRAFRQDPSYGHFYPWRDQFPREVYRHLLHKYRVIMLTPGARIMVAELDADDLPELHTDSDSGGSEKDSKVHEAGKIVGIATMLRSGGSKEEQAKWNAESTGKKIRRYILASQKALGSILKPNQAVSQHTIDTFWRDEVEIHESTGKPSNGKLDFLTLAVLPQYQRRGVGDRLLEYAAYRALKEGIPIFADASAKGLPLYLANGCKVIGTVVLPETTYKKAFGRRVVKRDRLETPVIRWDGANVTSGRVKLAESRLKASE